MSFAKLSILGFVVVALLTTVLMMGVAQIVAAPSGPTDESKVPHYFGPNPNWALSPLTQSNATVTITDPGSVGTGATAVATVDPVTGGIASIDLTSPGSGYTAADVAIGGGGLLGGATATAEVSTSGGVVGFTDIVPGSGYGAFDVALDGGGGTGATATASGGVNAVAVTGGGSGYTAPTVDFDLPDAPGGVKAEATAQIDANGTVTSVTVTSPGSGYTTAPGVAIHNGTLFDPQNLLPGGSLATATTTLELSAVNVVAVGADYTGVPTVNITDPSGTGGAGAGATAIVDTGAVTGITVTNAGTGYLDKGIEKFVDDLPGVCDPSVTLGDAGSCPDWSPTGTPDAKAIPLAVPEAKTYTQPDGSKPIAADEYEIALVQYRTSFSSSMPNGTLARGYVQLETPANASWSQHIPLKNELLDGTTVPAVDKDGTQLIGVTPPQYLGPFIAATKNKPVRIVFHNALPKDVPGNLFLPVDSSLMGSGMGPAGVMDPVDEGLVTDMVRNPVCTEDPQALDPMTGKGLCFKNNRATLHLHGGISPWISDGTPHQWITPANETTPWPEGVSVENVPDMNVGNAADDGVQTFYYTNQQSARLMFYHDHAWGITRLNVYAGEAAGYIIADKTEQKLIDSGLIPGPADTIPLIVQDKTFVPSDAQLYNQYDADGNVTSYGQDPTWDQTRWGREGDPWYHHVYMPAQNPGDPSGMSAYGRWMYGPWFWPPAIGTVHGPIANPYYNMDPATNFQEPLAQPCNLDDPSTWQYQTDPFCEPEQIPGTPNISVGMEQFNDTPLVNGVAYPKVTLQPKVYRLRFLNAANDRFFNLQWYVADPTQGNGMTEVALNPTELAAAQTDPNIFPTPVQNAGTTGPDWIQIGSEGGFLPKPVVVDGQQPTTWIIDPTRFDVGNVDKHSLLLAPAERADVIVDFSKFAAGTTLIMYNDAPAAFPARVSTYDYYTGAADLSPNGAPTILPGYGPNTRTVMQVTIGTDPAGTAFNLKALETAFSHKADGSGVFESGQHPIIVGQSDYNSAYGTNFATGSNCNAIGSTLQICDGLVRVNDTTQLKFNTLNNDRSAPLTLPLQPKAIHDEMNATTFDEFGRMQANLGVEAQPPSPGAQNVVLYPFVNPQTELIDGTNVPKNVVTYDTDGLPVDDVKITPIKTADGTQIWRITHNGVDTHPIHFHLYDVQVLNRVTWDNIILRPDPEELGWKDTIRISPLEDTIVALRPIVPDVPWELPNSVRPLNPMMPLGSTAMFNNVDPQGNPTALIVNELVNFGWEYVYHCHILSHEEMDMMRPVTLALPPNKPDGLAATFVPGKKNLQTMTLTWNDNSINETAFVVQQSTDGTTWNDVGTVNQPLEQSLPTGHGVRTFVQQISTITPYLYRVVAQNTVGYGAEFPTMTVKSVSASLGVNPPAAPTNLTATVAVGPQVSLTWRDNATNESGFVIERRTGGGAWAQIGTAPARTGTGNVTFVDATAVTGTTYDYRVAAVNIAGTTYSNTVTIDFSRPAEPTIVSATAVRQGNNERVTLTWLDNANNEASYTVQWSTSSTFTTIAGTATLGANATTYTTGNISRVVWYFRVFATNPLGPSTAATTTVQPAP